jgi:hypothetical protein
VFSLDSQTAYVTLQENNALALVDLGNNTITAILLLGLKDRSLEGNTIDSSDEIDFINYANWPIKGMYIPDAIASYEIAGVTYLITANEGDAREYDMFEEESKIGDNSYVLDPTIFPNADLLKLESNIGKLLTTTSTGGTDGDGMARLVH